MIQTQFLGAAIVTITLALVFYSIGAWAERIQKVLKGWHVICFVLGLIADTVGTGIMTNIAGQAGGSDFLHAITGLMAILLMALHAVWAIWIYFRGSDKAKQNFSKFSIVVWAFWLIPYFLGIFLGTSHA